MATQEDISIFTDVQLLEHLCSCDDDEKAYNLFIKRFMNDLADECKKICTSRKLDPHVGKQITHDVFERVRKYKSFKKENIRLPNNRRGIIVYLIRIAIRLFDDYHKQNQKSEIIHHTYFDDIVEYALNLDVKGLKEKKEFALFILKKLTERERRVVLLDIEYKRHQKYLPDEVIETLVIELKVNHDTIRKIRQRAIKKIKAAIDERSQN